MSNKSVRHEMEKIYGKKCMCCEGIRKICHPKPQKAKFKGKSIESQLTYHHIIPKSQNGKTSIENGAVLCRSCHTWLEELPNDKKEKINKELQEFKENKCKIVYVDDIKSDFIVIPLDFSIKKSKRDKTPYDRAKKKREDKEEIEKYYGDEIDD